MLVNYTVINHFFGQIMGEIDLGLFQIDLKFEKTLVNFTHNWPQSWLITIYN